MILARKYTLADMFLKKLSVVICFLLVACAPSPNDANFQVIENDRSGLYTALESSVFTLERAVSVALEDNLDAKIAEQDLVVSLSDVDLQKFNSLPTITAKRQNSVVAPWLHVSEMVSKSIPN